MTEPLINIVVSADYELFLGRNYVSHDEVLFGPTYEFLQVCDELRIPLTLFADVCSVWAHEQSGLNEYVTKFERQLISAARSGHDVQLHLHPHWLFSTCRDGQWLISTDKMYLSELSQHPDTNSAPNVIRRGREYLTGLLTPVSENYRCIAFRAAGLALQPGEEELIGHLLDNGILIDSSIAKGLKVSIDTITIDYTDIPEKANWRMNRSSGISREGADGLLEVPIASFKSSLTARMGFIKRRAASVGMRRGASISRSAKQSRLANLRSLVGYNLRYLYSDPWFLLSCDTKGVNLEMLLRGFDDYITRHKNEQQISLSMINHPKLMFTPQFELFRNFCKAVRDKYGAKIRFVTYSDLIA